MAKRAAGYFRLAEDGACERDQRWQKRWIQYRAATRGYWLIRIYADGHNEAALLCERLLADARSGQFDVVLGAGTLDGSDALEMVVIEELLTLKVEIETDKDEE